MTSGVVLRGTFQLTLIDFNYTASSPTTKQFPRGMKSGVVCLFMKQP